MRNPKLRLTKLVNTNPRLLPVLPQVANLQELPQGNHIDVEGNCIDGSSSTTPEEARMARLFELLAIPGPSTKKDKKHG